MKAGEYPADVADFDGVLITGSLSGVYDGDAWIQRLLNVRSPLRYSSLHCSEFFSCMAMAVAVWR